MQYQAAIHKIIQNIVDLCKVLWCFVELQLDILIFEVIVKQQKVKVFLLGAVHDAGREIRLEELVWVKRPLGNRNVGFVLLAFLFFTA